MAKKITFIIPDDIYDALKHLQKYYDCDTISGALSICIKKDYLDTKTKKVVSCV